MVTVISGQGVRLVLSAWALHLAALRGGQGGDGGLGVLDAFSGGTDVRVVGREGGLEDAESLLVEREGGEELVLVVEDACQVVH